MSVAQTPTEPARTAQFKSNTHAPDSRLAPPHIPDALGFGGSKPIGWWAPTGVPPRIDVDSLVRAIRDINSPVYVVQIEGELGIATAGLATLTTHEPAPHGAFPLRAYAPPIDPMQLGDAAFRKAHGVRYAYIAGEMANGIASVELVEAMGRAGMLGFFGAAGLEISRIEAAIHELQKRLTTQPFGFNLIHSPHDGTLEAATADLYLRRGVHRVCASAYLGLTLPVVKYRAAGLHRDPAGRIVSMNQLIAKVSRVEVASKFLSPPPAKMLAELVQSGQISPEQAAMAAALPLADDITAEADSGGHTDNRPAITLIPTMIALRDRIAAQHGYGVSPRIGAAGGIATPASVAAAFAMGAAYVVTGTINQCTREAGTSDAVRRMLAEAQQADVGMAPAADMFEMGVNVQVLRRGTLFAMRARKLYELYRTCRDLDSIPAETRAVLERDYFRASIDESWRRTAAFFAERDPAQLARAERDPHHKMALLFRSYLGLSSKWANTGEPTRNADYQVWCGPAMGAFNEWVRGSFLESVEHRDVATIAMNLMVGAAVQTRANALAAQGVPLPPAARRFAPCEMTELAAIAGLESTEPS